MGNCLPSLYTRHHDEVEESMGASQSAQTAISGSATAAQGITTSSNSDVNGETQRRHRRSHNGQGRVVSASAYVNELMASSTLTGSDEVRMHVQLEEKRKARVRGLLDQLRVDRYEQGQLDDECAICMGEFNHDESIRRLPCKHVYHLTCIDDWLLRSFTCPSCMEPVDSALLAAFTPKQGVDLASLVCSPASLGSSTRSVLPSPN